MSNIQLLNIPLFVIFLIGLFYSFREIKNHSHPFLFFLTAYYFFFFGVLSFYASIYIKDYNLPFDNQISISVVIYLTAFITAQLIGYIGIQRFVNTETSFDNFDNLIPNIILAWSGITLVLMFYIFPIMSELPSLPQLKHPFWCFSLATLTYLAMQKKISTAQILVLVGVVLLKLTLDLKNGLLTPIVFSVLIICSTSFFLGYRKITISCIIIIVLTVSSYGYVKYFAMNLISGNTHAIFDFQPKFNFHNIKASVNAMSRRSSPALLTGHVFTKTPETIPFEDRNPFLDTITNHVPRVLWAEKPIENHGNEFGRRYEVLNPGDLTTSWNIPWAVDLYITGGIYWSICWAFLIGILIGLGKRLIVILRDRTFEFGLYASTILPLFYQESNISLMAGNIFSFAGFLIFSWLLVRLLCKKRGLVRN